MVYEHYTGMAGKVMGISEKKDFVGSGADFRLKPAMTVQGSERVQAQY